MINVFFGIDCPRKENVKTLDNKYIDLNFEIITNK